MAGAQLSETCTISFRSNSVIACFNSCGDIMSELVLCLCCPLQVGTLQQAYPPVQENLPDIENKQDSETYSTGGGGEEEEIIT